MRTPVPAVRLLPLVVLVAACSVDGPVGPEGTDPSLLVTVESKPNTGDPGGAKGRWTNGDAHLGDFSVSEQRLWHARYYPDPVDPTAPGHYRVCQLNPFENADGSNWKNGEGRGGKLHVNEPNGFVLIKERPAAAGDLVDVGGVLIPRPVGGAYPPPYDHIPAIPLNEVKGDGTSGWEVTYIGRVQWTSNGFLYPGGKEISRHSLGKGVVAPAAAYMRLVGSGPSEGLWDGTATTSNHGHDLFNVLLGPGDVWTAKIDDLLSSTYATSPGDLRYVECNVDFYWKVTHNEIVTDAKIPVGFLNLIPGVR